MVPLGIHLDNYTAVDDDDDDDDEDENVLCTAGRWIALHIPWQPSHLQPGALGFSKSWILLLF